MTDAGRKIIDFILRKVIRRPSAKIDVDTRLVSSGLIDSFALVDILGVLEDVTDMDIPAGKIQPKDMDTVRLMLETAARVGRARRGEVQRRI
jgi:acyl carrier protein